MAKHVKRSVVPIYLVGAVWLAYALLFPLYQPVHYLLCGALSKAAFIVGKGLFPNKVYEVPGEPEENKQEEPEKKEPPKSTGDPEIDALIKERDRAVGEMRRLNDSIEDEEISAQIDHLEEVTRKIIDLVVKQPKKLPQIRRFLDYYLPTTQKLLDSYAEFEEAGVSGENLNQAKAKIQSTMDSIVAGFERQLDELYRADAMDIDSDIRVMETMLRRDSATVADDFGLGGSTAVQQEEE